VQEVHFEAGKPGPSVLQYEYDPMGNRLAKKKMYYDVDQYGLPVYWSEGQYYVRDPQGNVLAVYDHRDRLANVVNEAGDSLYLEELHLYGSARLGILKKRATLKEFQKSLELPGDDLGDLLLFKSSAALVASSYQQLELGRRRYELSNHLGNVLATVSDKSLGQDSSQTGQADYYLAQVSSASLYYPFGWEMPGRKFVSGEGYRFGFNGKEDDRDWGTQNIQDYGFRLYNPSIGKFLSVDPLSPDYPWYTPYQFAGNKPINSVDLDGGEEKIIILWVDFEKGVGNLYGDATLVKVEVYDINYDVDYARTVAYTGVVGARPLFDFDPVIYSEEAVSGDSKNNPKNLAPSSMFDYSNPDDMLWKEQMDKEFLANGGTYAEIAERDKKALEKNYADVDEIKTAIEAAVPFLGVPIGRAGKLVRYKLGKNDLDLRGTGKTYRDGLNEAFKRTGYPKEEFKVAVWGKDKYGKSVPVEYHHPSGAKVNMDYTHANDGPDAPHIGYQKAGKKRKGKGDGERGHIILDEVPAGRTNKKE